MPLQVKEVAVDRLNPDNRDYALGIERSVEYLEHSVQKHGVLEPVTVLQLDNSLVILSGHNRVKAAKSAGIEQVPAFEIEEITADIIMSQALCRMFQGRIGPVGRIRALQLYERLSGKVVDSQIFSELGLPRDFARKELREEFLSLHDSFLKFLDVRDIAFKTILLFMKLPGDYREGLSHFFSLVSFTAGQLKKTVEILHDLGRKNVPFSEILTESALTTMDSSSFYKHCYSIRYPRFTKRSAKLELARARVGATCRLSYNEYMQSDELKVEFMLTKRRGIESFKKDLQQVDLDALGELLDLL